MPTTRTSPLAQEDLVEAARAAIWRLFEDGCIDDDMATTSLLAIDLGIRRIHRANQHGNGAAGAKPTHRAA